MEFVEGAPAQRPRGSRKSDQFCPVTPFHNRYREQLNFWKTDPLCKVNHSPTGVRASIIHARAWIGYT